MQLKTIKISDLTPHGKNPNKHPEKQLNELGDSLDEFEQVKNIVVWNNKVIAGCGFLEAAKRQNRDVIAVQDVSAWPEEKAISYMIADNRLPELAIMDDDLLSDLLMGFDEPLDIPGVDESLLDDLNSHVDIIENEDLEKRTTERHFYGASGRGFRFGDLMSYIMDAALISKMENFTDKIINYDDSQVSLDAIGKKMVLFILENENLFLPKI